jgi:hypothetical protein
VDSRSDLLQQEYLPVQEKEREKMRAEKLTTRTICPVLKKLPLTLDRTHGSLQKGEERRTDAYDSDDIP